MSRWVLLLLLLPSIALADAPFFRGGPAGRSTYRLPARTDLELAWWVSTQGKIRSTPAVAGEVVVLGSEDGLLRAVGLQDGAEIWTVPAGGPVLASPAVADGRVVVPAGGVLRCFDLADGAPLWEHSFGPSLLYEQFENDPRTWDAYRSSPVVVDGTAYVGSLDGRLYALALEDGAVRWSHDTEAVIWSSPAVAAERVHVGDMEGRMWCLDAGDGTVLWRFQTVGSPSFPRGEIQSSPAVSGGTVYFGSRDAGLYALDAVTGDQRWRVDHAGSWVVGSPAVGQGLVVVGSSDGQFVQAVDAATGEERWRYHTDSRVFASAALVEGLAWVGTWDGELLGISLATGAVRARNGATAAILASPVPADSLVLVGSDDSRLYAFTGPVWNPRQEPRPVHLEAEQLQPLAGAYEMPSGRLLVMGVAEDGLTATLGGQVYGLRPTSPVDFFFVDLPASLRFVLDGEGGVERLELIQGEQVTPAPRRD